MTRLKFLIAVLFAIALGTGVVVGMGMSRQPKAPVAPSWLTQELNLSSQQSEQIHKIWSDSMKPVQTTDRRHQYQKERDEQLQALLTDAQKAQYADILKKYNEEIEKLNHEREAAFQAAVESTKQVLSDAQRAKYDELMKNGFRGPPRDRGDGPRHGASTRHGPENPGEPATAPAPATRPAAPV
jgi:Spy/CpxP family protein refolding chaperone